LRRWRWRRRILLRAKPQWRGEERQSRQHGRHTPPNDCLSAHQKLILVVNVMARIAPTLVISPNVLDPKTVDSPE
jgi:hypothetical protein